MCIFLVSSIFIQVLSTETSGFLKNCFAVFPSLEFPNPGFGLSKIKPYFSFNSLCIRFLLSVTIFLSFPRACHFFSVSLETDRIRHSKNKE